MPAPRFRSRTYRRIHTRVTIHYKERKPKIAKCGSCGAKLKGVPRERPYKMQQLPKTKKRPERPYGGNLCSTCMRKLMVEKARV